MNGLPTARGLGSPDLASPFERRILPASSFGIGRVCLGFEHREGCGTILSRYNPGPLCYICTRYQVDRERAARQVSEPSGTRFPAVGSLADGLKAAA